MRGQYRRWLLIGVLVTCAGLHVLEVSGQWDRTLADTSDELSLVIGALCVGAAIVLAKTRVTAQSARRLVRDWTVAESPAPWSAPRVPLMASCADPPPLIPLRI